jgi:predicted Rdx family selenoprotein
LAAELKKECGMSSDLMASDGGRFDVLKDGKTIYSKKNTGRFPHAGEVVTLLKEN